MSSSTKFVDQLVESIKVQINTFAPARVIAFYEADQEADIEILFMSADKQRNLSKYPLITRAPVLGMRHRVNGVVENHRPVLYKGDLVFVAFAQRSLDNLQKVHFDPDDIRKHDMRDAVVLGGWKL